MTAHAQPAAGGGGTGSDGTGTPGAANPDTGDPVAGDDASTPPPMSYGPAAPPSEATEPIGPVVTTG